MAKTKKITAAHIERAMGIEKEKTAKLIIGEGENAVEVTVKKTLSLYERSNIVEDIVSMIFMTGDDGEEIYAPYMMKFAFGFNILNYFTNIPLPADINKVWEFMQNTDIVRQVIAKLDDGYITPIIREIDELTEFKKNKIVNRSKFDDLAGALVELINGIKAIASDVDLGELLDKMKENAPEIADGKMGEILAGFSEAMQKTTEA